MFPSEELIALSFLGTHPVHLESIEPSNNPARHFWNGKGDNQGETFEKSLRFTCAGE